MRIIADGGIAKSRGYRKGANPLARGHLRGILAGCPEAPGQIMEINGKLYKQYRGMGSPAAMKSGSAARYGHGKDTTRKVAAEGVEALKEVSASLDNVMTQLVGAAIRDGVPWGRRPSMNYASGPGIRGNARRPARIRAA